MHWKHLCRWSKNCCMPWTKKKCIAWNWNVKTEFLSPFYFACLETRILKKIWNMYANCCVLCQPIGDIFCNQLSLFKHLPVDYISTTVCWPVTSLCLGSLLSSFLLLDQYDHNSPFDVFLLSPAFIWNVSLYIL